MSDGVIQPITNPLISSLRIPGETFRLPSRGMFYTNGELDPSVEDGELEVLPMTAIDEIVLSTPDKLLSGKAIKEVFGRCIPQVRNAGKLLAKDVDFLMVCLRMVSFGPTMEVVYDHDCSANSKEHTYTVQLQEMIHSAKSMDPTTLNQQYTVTLPNGQVVSLKPIMYDDIISMYQRTMSMKTETMTEEEAEAMIVATIVSVIRDVNGVTDKAHIDEWVRKLPLGWKKQIKDAMEEASEWGIELRSPQICKDCGEDLSLIIQANPVNFFF